MADQTWPPRWDSIARAGALGNRPRSVGALFAPVIWVKPKIVQARPRKSTEAKCNLIHMMPTTRLRDVREIHMIVRLRDALEVHEYTASHALPMTVSPLAIAKKCLKRTYHVHKRLPNNTVRPAIQVHRVDPDATLIEPIPLLRVVRPVHLYHEPIVSATHTVELWTDARSHVRYHSIAIRQCGKAVVGKNVTMRRHAVEHCPVARELYRQHCKVGVFAHDGAHQCFDANTRLIVLRGIRRRVHVVSAVARGSTPAVTGSERERERERDDLVGKHISFTMELPRVKHPSTINQPNINQPPRFVRKGSKRRFTLTVRVHP